LIEDINATSTLVILSSIPDHTACDLHTGRVWTHFHTTYRERGTDRQRDREAERGRQTERERQRKADRQRERQTDREREAERGRERQTDREAGRQRGREAVLQ